MNSAKSSQNSRFSRCQKIPPILIASYQQKIVREKITVGGTFFFKTPASPAKTPAKLPPNFTNGVRTRFIKMPKMQKKK